MIYREVLSRFTTGVVAITASRRGLPVGMAVNSFSSVSLDPMLVLFCAAHSSTTWPSIRDAGHFAVNILPEGSEDLVRRFAAKGADRFDGVPYRTGITGAPILRDAIAYLDCEIHRVHDEGDHAIVVGEVRDQALQADVAPLVFYASRYRSLRPDDAGDLG